MDDEELLKRAENNLSFLAELDSIPDPAQIVQETIAASLLVIARNSVEKTDFEVIDPVLSGSARAVTETREYSDQYHMVEVEDGDAHVMHFDCEDITNCVVMNDLKRRQELGTLPDSGEYTAHVKYKRVVYDLAGREGLKNATNH